MASDADKIHAVPTNVITGFLGVGKSTAILHLIAQKPAGERWAVLVNEFGEIGVDGSVLRGAPGDDIYVEEVPGGCMCCVSGLPMQIALNRLLRRAKPHRLLVEPTGLGHPVEVLQSLSSEHNREVLSLGPTLTLVDARNISDPRYRAHETFVQQLAIADVVVANKADLYGPEDLDALNAFVPTHCQPDTTVQVTEQGRVELAALQGTPQRSFSAASGHRHAQEPVLASDLLFPASGVVSAANTGEGFESIGWRFAPTALFARARVKAFLNDLCVERAKAVFITPEGIFGYNKTRDGMTEHELDDCAESRIEIIADAVDTRWEERLTACIEPA